MVKRSLQACPAQIHQAKRAFALKGWTQENLACEINLKTRQPIWRFFTGQPVERQIFVEICSILDLDWREIALDPPAEFPELGRRSVTNTLDLDRMVERIRAQQSETIRDRCGVVQLLEIGRPIWIEDIYIDLSVFEDLGTPAWCQPADLQTGSVGNCLLADDERHERQQRSALVAAATHSKLLVLGRPGAGKTMLLKHLAIQCDRGEFAADRVPLFITLADFAVDARDRRKFDLSEYICASGDASITDASISETLLQSGRCLLLLDGIDEIAPSELTATLQELRKFTDKYHKNQFIVTSRTTARHVSLRGFMDVELAPFARAQIANFAHKWFVTIAKKDPQSARALSLQLLQNLDLPENWQLRQLAATPLFLHLACGEWRSPTKNPAQRLDFYERVLNLLLGNWDAAKGIDRANPERGLSLPQKLRLLSQLAAVTFESSQSAIDRREIECYIGDYLCSLPYPQLAPEELQIESAAILSEIATYHGLLVERTRGTVSFLALGFQEYFLARKITNYSDLGGLERSLRELVEHLTDPRWHEVFLLTANMLRNTDLLMQLMRSQIELLVDREPYLQAFVQWLDLTSPAQQQDSKPSITWVRQLKSAIADYQNISEPAESPSERIALYDSHREQLLQSYCYANQLLLDCWSERAETLPSIGRDIATTLTLPPKVASNTNLPWIPTLISPLRPPQRA